MARRRFGVMIQMFLRTTKNSSGHTYLKIVRSFRQDGKVKQEILFTLGRLDVLAASGELDGLVAALSRYCSKQNLIDLAKDVSIEKVYHLGGVHVVRRFLERLGLSKLFNEIENSYSRLEMAWSEIVTAMIVSRFIEPCSKKRLWDEWLKKIYPGLLDLTQAPLTQLYRAMDILYEHKKTVEEALFSRNGERDLFNQTLDVVFYDTTTLRFESVLVQEGRLRQFGYSKERRSDCTQVVLGLLIDRDGLPVGYELFPGNTYDGKCIPAMLAKFKEKFQIGNVVFVADRGMLSAENLASLREARMEFIIGMRLWSVAEEEQRDFYDIRRYRSISAGLKIREMSWGDERLILTYSEDRARRDAKAREDILDKIRLKLQSTANTKCFVTHSAYRKYLKGLDKGKPSLDWRAIAHAQKRDGFFGILTNVAADKLGSQEVVARYKELWKIEDAFGEMKGPLETRPMFHWTDRRIEAHVLLCVLAYYLEAVITRQLRQNQAGFTVAEFFRSLNEVYAIPVQVRKSTAWIRNVLPAVAAQGYQLLNLKPPDRVLMIAGSDVVPQNFSN